MQKKQTQDDIEFLAACGIEQGSTESKKAINVREELAIYGRVNKTQILAEQKIIDSGIFHPTDSLDLLEFSIMLEELELRTKLDDQQIQDLADSISEEITVKDWISELIQIENKSKHNQAG